MTLAKDALIVLTVMTVFAASTIFFLSKPPITGHMVDVPITLFVTGTKFDYNCTIPMVDGWNLISFLCTPPDIGIDSVLAPINGSYASIHTYINQDPIDPWKSYKSDLPVWVEQDLARIDDTLGYWILITSPVDLLVNGTFTGYIPTVLYTGWNLIGYPTNSTQTPEEAFIDINTTIASVHMYNASDLADFWKVWAPSLNASQTDLKLMVPNFGYWVNSTSGSTWFTPLQ